MRAAHELGEWPVLYAVNLASRVEYGDAGDPSYVPPQQDEDGYAYQDDPAQPIAHVVGTFMRMGKGVAGDKQLKRDIQGAGA